mgnify:CR=1 FL=1
MSLPLPVRNPALFNEVAQWLCQIPHSRILQIEFVQAERGRATMCLPYQECLIGDSRTGVLHGGVGIVVGQDARGRPMILGGNQGDRVCIAPFDPARLLAYRWPAGATDPQLPLPLMVSSAASSSDEA